MFLLSVAKFVELCTKTETGVEFGPTATKTLLAIRDLYNKGANKNSAHLDFEGCGVGPFRDKALGHPLNSIKVVLEKAQYKISLDWKNVEDLLALIKRFVDEVERHHEEKDPNHWPLNTYLEGMIDIRDDFSDLQIALDHAAEYQRLLRESLLAMGDMTIRMNYQTHELEIVKSVAPAADERKPGGLQEERAR